MLQTKICINLRLRKWSSRSIKSMNSNSSIFRLMIVSRKLTRSAIDFKITSRREWSSIITLEANKNVLRLNTLSLKKRLSRWWDLYFTTTWLLSTMNLWKKKTVYSNHFGSSTNRSKLASKKKFSSTQAWSTKLWWAKLQEHDRLSSIKILYIRVLRNGYICARSTR